MGSATEVDVKGRKIIPAADFVQEHGVKTVFGVGGAFASGQILVVLVFASEEVPMEVVEHFRDPFLRFKAATATTLQSVFSDGISRDVEKPQPTSPQQTTPSTDANLENVSREELVRMVAKNRAELAAINDLYLGLEWQLEERTRA